MDEYVNWDQADPAIGAGLEYQLGPLAAADPLHDLDLVLENVEGDDFSYWALQHFENSNPLTLDPAEVNNPMTLMDTAMELTTSPKAMEEYLEVEAPDAPCAHCQMRGYDCKRIREGNYKGYCTSCVALRCACSFGLAPATHVPTDSAFPHNPWPLMGDHPDAITQEGVPQPEKLPAPLSTPTLPGLTSISSQESIVPTASTTAPKIGARFSRESVKILKNWLSTHHKHPYPSEDEKTMLQKQTGLDKTQITNWLANARRRGKIVAPRSTSPGVRSFSNAIDIPQRRGTPASFENMNPLQRWQISPPENEPASVTAIARAVTASAGTLSSGLNSPYSQNFTDDGSGRSLCAVSSISSVNTSHSSGGSFASAYSHASRNSFGSLGSLDRGRRRRRRKVAARKPEEKVSLSAPLKTFMCTFCTETFRTKHDWQRHEKSLHLSLERWVCTPDGPRGFNSDNQISCVFCGLANPDEDHIESHNHSACQERTLEERTFYRKDHLRQHLKLVHGVKFADWSMNQWKVATPEIRSRCGFCGIVMDTWTIRVDHLAEHFKTGNTMADWKGDWGFDAPVLDMVENSIPPYLIHDERATPFPYQATQGSPETARNAYELIKSELMYFINNETATKGKSPNDEELQVEACRIVFGAEVLSKQGISSTPSWLRDLLLSSDHLALQARLAPIRSHADSRQSHLKINGKDNIFEEDSLELELREFVKAHRLIGLTTLDRELQGEACKIIGRMEESSSSPSDGVANFLVRLIYSSTTWLAGFRQRATLPRSEDVGDEANRSKDLTKIDSTIHNYSRLESDLAEFVRTQRSMGVEPSDADLQKQARMIIYEFDDGWNQTAADNEAWLSAFKQRHVSSFSSAGSATSSTPLTVQTKTPACSSSSGSPSLFVNDSNCYRTLSRELGRYVAATMSANNPNSHVPSDQELQHQARWILYDDDDPWNQTPADNAEWLCRFKREVGILTDKSIPGLTEGSWWNDAAQSGSEFPQLSTNADAPAIFETTGGQAAVTAHGDFNSFPTGSATGNDFLQSLKNTKNSPPSRRTQLSSLVFCSRELESGLDDYVSNEAGILGAVAFPSDEALRSRAREILQTLTTPADDPVLLEKFKDMMRKKLGLMAPSGGSGLGFILEQDCGAFGGLTMTDSEMNDITQGMNFEFGDAFDDFSGGFTGDLSSF
ncbi:hypothetical protein B0T22DRAFT_439276 [Podospora appendiculata]|uniref:Uncharacterized protein n=1 Tax=Podospora appendiculata TaxID=314037 RepID=A0AAE0X7W7_9PEZI|nr:hypothetical protein B0T22DRAFT_439276 [Podospora appendiculata]